MSFPVIYDASVLYPAPLRDFLTWLALSGLFRAHWSDTILNETFASIAKDPPDFVFMLDQLNSQLTQLQIL